MFHALLVEKDEDGNTSASVQELPDERLPDGDVTVAVSHSTVNYKDGLCIGPGGGLVRNYPHVPGIDFAPIPHRGQCTIRLCNLPLNGTQRP